MFSTLKTSVINIKPKSATRKSAKQASAIQTRGVMLDRRLDRLNYSWATKQPHVHHSLRMRQFAKDKLKEMLDIEHELQFVQSQKHRSPDKILIKQRPEKPSVTLKDYSYTADQI